MHGFFKMSWQKSAIGVQDKATSGAIFAPLRRKSVSDSRSHGHPSLRQHPPFSYRKSNGIQGTLLVATMPPSPSRRAIRLASDSVNFNRTPMPPPFSSMNTAPSVSSADLRAAIVSGAGCSSLRSNCSMTASSTAERLASLARVTSTSARPARHCDPVITRPSFLCQRRTKWPKSILNQFVMSIELEWPKANGGFWGIARLPYLGRIQRRGAGLATTLPTAECVFGQLPECGVSSRMASAARTTLAP